MLGSEFVLVSLDSEECQDLGSTHPRTMLQGTCRWSGQRWLRAPYPPPASGLPCLRSWEVKVLNERQLRGCHPYLRSTWMCLVGSRL